MMYIHYVGSRLRAVAWTALLGWTASCSENEAPEGSSCGAHGTLHSGPGADPHCHCDEGYTEVEGLCVAGMEVPGQDTEVCGGHGVFHEDHCDCEAGFQQDPLNRRTCVAVPQPTGERLVVADPAAQRLFVFEMGTWELVADFSNLQMNDHAGFLPLEDGRLLFFDQVAAGLRVASIGGVETPALSDAIPVRGAVAHISVDPRQQYAVVSGSLDDEGSGVFTLVTLADLSTREFLLATGEPGVALGGEPLMLFHRNSAPPQFEMYERSALTEGELEPLDVAAIGGAPHGEGIGHSRNKIVSATDEGIDIVPYDDEQLGSVTTVPYDVNGLSGGRAFYARLSGDGRYLYSYLRDSGAEGSTWGEWRSDAYIVDLETDTAKRLEIGGGLVYRLGSCATMAAFTQYHPDGDFLHLLDANPASPAFQTFVARIPLERMRLTPAPEEDVWASEAFRVTALSNDCRWAFVTHGGDGKISVVDTTTRELVTTLTTPTSLAYGGYLVGVSAGTEVVDTIAR